PLLQSDDVTPLLLDVGSGGSAVSHIAISDTKANGQALQVRESAKISDVAVTSAGSCVVTFDETKMVSLDKVTATGTGSSTCIDGTGAYRIPNSSVTNAVGNAVNLEHGSIADTTISGRVGLLLGGAGTTGRRLTVSGDQEGVSLSHDAVLTDAVVTATTGDAV